MKPPFSSKKQSEFPDAIVLSSLENWCKSWRKLYIVSGDPDFENFCSNSKNLIHINSLPDFITKALVSKEFQEKLYKFFENNEGLHDDLSSTLNSFTVKFIIPTKSNRKYPAWFDREMYKQRNLVERFFGKIKRSFRSIATRYDKYSTNFMAMIKIASVRLWCEFYESAT